MFTGLAICWLLGIILVAFVYFFAKVISTNKEEEEEMKISVAHTVTKKHDVVGKPVASKYETITHDDDSFVEDVVVTMLMMEALEESEKEVEEKPEIETKIGIEESPKVSDYSSYHSDYSTSSDDYSSSSDYSTDYSSSTDY